MLEALRSAAPRYVVYVHSQILAAVLPSTLMLYSKTRPCRSAAFPPGWVFRCRGQRTHQPRDVYPTLERAITYADHRLAGPCTLIVREF